MHISGFVVSVTCFNGKLSCENPDWPTDDLSGNWEEIQRGVERLVREKLLANHEAVDCFIRSKLETDGTPLLISHMFISRSRTLTQIV